MLSALLAPFLLLSSALAAPSAPLARASVCNGHASLCDRSYGNVTFIGAHNSYANGTTVADNQNKGVVAQLNDGVRMLQMQAHSTNTGIHLCHTTCTLRDGGSLQDYLTNVNSWLSANPNEVITLLIVNSDGLAPSAFATAFQGSGIVSSVYTPTTATQAYTAWPTLGQMIDAGGRVVVFMDTGADFSSVPYIMDEFSNAWEDAYDVTSQDFSCTVNRTAGSPSTTLYITNHFLDVYGEILGFTSYMPDKSKLNETNAETGYGSIGQGVSNCEAAWGRPPNHILLDFYDSNGNAPFNVAASLNGVPAPTNTVVPPSSSSAAAASSTTGVTTKSLSGAGRATQVGWAGVGACALASAVGAALLAV